MVKAKPASSSRPTRPTKEEKKAEAVLRKQGKEKAKEEKKADEALRKQAKAAAKQAKDETSSASGMSYRQTARRRSSRWAATSVLPCGSTRTSWLRRTCEHLEHCQLRTLSD